MKKLHLFFMALLVLCLGLFVSACSLKIVNDGEDGEIIVRLKEYKPEIELGKTYEIPFEVINTEVSFEYEIEDKSIISVKDGIITALKIGETKVFITATCSDEEGTTKDFTLTVKVIEPQSVSYTISYRSNVNGFEKNSDTVEEGEDFTLGEAPEIEGYDFLGWSLSLDFEAITELENINEDKVVYAIYAAKEYEITYNLDGGEYQGVAKAKHGETIQLGTPEKEGFDFLGWSLQQGGTQYVTEVLVEGPVTLYANWEEKIPEPEQEYPINYDLDGGKWNVEYNTPAQIGSQFIAEFNEFNGLEIDPSELDTDYMGSNKFGDFFKDEDNFAEWHWLLVAVWEVNGSPEDYDPDSVEFGDLIGFYMANFNGYFTSTLHSDTWLGNTSADFSNPAISKAVTEKSEPISGEMGPEKYLVGVGVASLPAPIRGGYQFKGWVDEQGNPVTSISATQTGVVTLKATWEAETVEHTITYNLDGGEYQGVAKAKHGETIQLGTPEKEGFDFLGWVLEGTTEYITEIEVLEDVTLVAEWVEQVVEPTEYTITYDLDGGKWNAQYGTPAEIGAQFIAEFNAFNGMSISMSELDTDYMGSNKFGNFFKDENNFAKWHWLLVAVWEVNESPEDFDPDNKDFGDLIGFYMANFNGYFTSTLHSDTWLGNTSADFSNPAISKAVTEKSEPVSGEFGPSKYTEGVGVESIPAPLKEDYIFKGWVDEQGNSVTSISATQTGNLTLKATWEAEPNECPISYDLDGGHWNVQYHTPAEIGAQFIAEFNAFNGMSISISELDTDYMGSNKFGNFFKDENNFAKWHWLLVAVWEVNESPEDFDPDNKDFSDLIGFYMANFNGYFTSTLHSDTWLGNTSADFSNPAISKAVTEKSEPVSSDVIPEEYTKGVGLEVLPTPLKDEFIFDGWMMPNGEVITSIPATMKGALQLKAVWKPLDTEYTITYELDGGSYEGAQSAVHGSTLTLGTPEKEGFDFLGWSLQAGSTEYITEIVVKEDLVIYANWEEIIVIPEGTYQITYDLDGGHWVYTYYTPAEIGAEFIAEFNKFNGMNITPSELDTNNMSSTKFGNFFKNADNLNKWMWLLDAVWEVGKGDDSNKASTADFGKGAVIGFYMANLNGYFTSKQHKDTWLEKLSADYADPDNSLAVTLKSNPKSEEAGPATYEAGVGIEGFPTPLKDEHIFMGWVDEQNNPVTSISTTQTGAITLKAVWEHETIAEGIQFTNLPEDGVKLYTELQLEWVVTPEEAVNKNVVFYSLDSNIISVTENGIIKGVSEGTGRIRVRLESNPEFEMILSVKVWNGDYFDVYYVTESYMRVGETIQLFAEYVDKAQERHEVTWSSLTDSIATVNAVGEVTGVAEGLATIRATYNDDKYFDFYVTVLSSELSDEMMFVLGNHISNAKTTYDLGIGDGNPEYYYDVVSGVNNLIFDELKIDRRYYDKLPEGTKNYGVMSSVEFITVHYTGNMAYSADADNNCDYFNDLDYRASIHFVTGRTNLSDLTGLNAGYSADAYYAFAGLNEKYAGWHATNGDPCVWDDTGLLVQDTDPLTPVISISENNKYTINGRETNITIPEVPAGYTVNGAVLTVEGKQYSVFNQYGLRAKVEDGKYYLARTHWGTQRTPRAICTCGGNRNSIGIESCVDMGSDLEHTWHVTAQLVAKLLLDNNLGFDRVVGHHFFSGKDCPQPFLERDMKLWYEFMDMVKAEYERITSFKDAVITAKAINGEGVLRDNGLLIQDSDAHCVTYEVSINVNGQIQKVTLATCVESCLKFDGTRQYASLQIQGYPVI